MSFLSSTTRRRRARSTAALLSAAIAITPILAERGFAADRLRPAASSGAPATAAPQSPSQSAPAKSSQSQAATVWTLPAPIWAAWRAAFLDASGRVVDTANGDISHSEGQGYGLLLAVYANDWATFDQIWTFTLTELLIRDDGLAAWKWDPNHKPHVVDINNATDGDILIAWALAQAASLWNEPRYRDAATRIAKAVGSTMLRSFGGYTLILPGAAGFDHSADGGGVIINPSYWVFEALPVLASLAPDYDWTGAERSGLDLLSKAQFGSYSLPSDWIQVSVNGDLAPAPGFDPVFGYNSLRIPLYLLGAGHTEKQRLEPYDHAWVQDGRYSPLIVDVETGKVVERLTEPGYEILAALVSCSLSGTSVPYDLREFQPTSYFASTLHLLAMTVLARRYAKCL
ncbi:glycosyl hydrolase family 8 [Pseudoxanthobacter soli]|uniref:glycosyl hydrolase family 8 n=1 Tax=Pseudoxanthobacter soli TaxID=433840 RepID=UPI001FCE29F6|nr:glycosyl hydrolase family 8 [Pseudoxanthobacter soli]